MQDRKVTKCVDCGKPTDPKQNGIYFEMYGWSEYRGSTGGSNNLKWKKVTGRVLCIICARARKDGTTGQDSLF